MPNQIIRRDKDGKVDDVVIDGDLFRLEQMDDDFWRLAIYRGDKRVAFNIRGRGRPVDIFVVEDELGCMDDKEELCRKTL